MNNEFSSNLKLQSLPNLRHIIFILIYDYFLNNDLQSIYDNSVGDELVLNFNKMLNMNRDVIQEIDYTINIIIENGDIVDFEYELKSQLITEESLKEILYELFIDSVFQIKNIKLNLTIDREEDIISSLQSKVSKIRAQLNL